MGQMYLKDQPELEIGDFRTVNRPGRYPVTITVADETVSSTDGSPMIKLRVVVEGDQNGNDGVSAFDNLVCAGKAGAFSKKRLRQLGVPVDSDQPIDLSQITARLLGQKLFADLEPEAAFEKNPRTNKYDLPKMKIGANGQEERVYNTKVTAYYQHNPSAQSTQAPVQQAQPPQAQFGASPGFGGSSPGYATPPPGFAQPNSQAAVAPAGYPQTPPPGFGPPMNGYPPQAGGAPAPWAQAPQQTVQEPVKKVRGKNSGG